MNLNTADTAIKNEPIRGDLKGVKIADGTAQRLANIPFKITSLTTGESHTIITDRNGQFDTSSAWNPHSQNTNRGTTDRDGIWFGDIDTLDDSVGALLYDDYLIEEQRCEANKDMELLSFEVSIYRHNTTIDLGTLTDDYGKQPEILSLIHIWNFSHKNICDKQGHQDGKGDAEKKDKPVPCRIQKFIFDQPQAQFFSTHSMVFSFSL